MMKLAAMMARSPASPATRSGSGPRGRKSGFTASASEKTGSPDASTISASQHRATASGYAAASSSMRGA